jgi:DNA polymerase III delta prime subunit
MRLYVKTDLFEKGRAFLRENKSIIICGEPGVGKTTLAEMLIYEYIKEDYKFTYILDDIKEADKALTNDEEKQIIYFDDFLGSNAVEINKAKGSETTLRKVLRRVVSQNNKLIVFTTRSFLLNTAISESENLTRFNIKAKQSILNLSEYTTEIKLQILLNHIEDSDLNEDLKEVILRKSVQEFIISHKNFTPRSVEFITTSEFVKTYSKLKFETFIYASFNSPINIWEHAYSEQIKEDDRLLLNTLLTFGEFSRVTDLEKAFHYRLKYESENNNKVKEIQAFSKSLKRLEDGFIIIKKNEIHFINPSLIDFLITYLRQDKDEVTRMIDSVCFVTQLTERLFSISSKEYKNVPENLKNRILDDYYSFVTIENISGDLIRLALFIHKYIKDIRAEEIVCEIIQEIEDWDSLYDDYTLNFYFREFMDSVRDNEKINKVIKNRIIDILTDLVIGEDDLNQSIDILEELISKYKIDFKTVDASKIEEHFNTLINDYVNQEIDWLRDYISDEGEVFEKKEEIKRFISRITAAGLQLESDLSEFDNNDWYDIAMHNEFRRLMEKDD